MTGYLIAFVGIDGAGKSHASNQLAELLRSRGNHVTLTYEPTDAAREAVLRGDEDAAFLDRLNHCAEVIGPRMELGDIVITDRYYACQAAYSTVEVDAARAVMALYELRDDVPGPDLWIFVRSPIAICEDRVLARGEDFDRAEMRAVNYRYDKILGNRENTIRFDGVGGGVWMVANEIRTRIEAKRLARKKH